MFAMKNASSKPQYNTDPELFLQARKGDKKALEKIVAENERLLQSVLSRYTSCSTPKEDLAQIAYIGLIKAIKRFEPEYGLQFSTYAVSVITGELKSFFRSDGFVKASRHLKNIYYKAKLLRETSQKDTGRDLSLEDLAEKLHCDKYEVLSAFEACSPPVYLNQKLSENEELSLEDVLQDQSFSLEEHIDKLVLSSILSSLEALPRKIITLRYLLGKTQTQTAALLGMSQVQVCRKEKKILLELKKLHLPQ